jgi:hypothetical protein
VFRPYDPQEKAAPGVSDPAPSDLSNKGKGAPTPTRKHAEAARRQRVNPVLTKKEARVHEREVRRANQVKSMAAQDNRPERVLMRDYIDARFNVTEILLPAWILVLAVSLLGTKWPLLVEIAVFVVWGLLALAVIDLYVMWRGYKKLLAVKYPDAATRGMLMLAVNRALSIRAWRSPAPRVKRGTKL